MTSREEREWWPRLKAREIIKNLKISDPSELIIEDIAWTQGALVKEGGLCGCDARLVHTPDVSPAILRVRKYLSAVGKRRFAIARTWTVPTENIIAVEQLQNQQHPGRSLGVG